MHKKSWVMLLKAKTQIINSTNTDEIEYNYDQSIHARFLFTPNSYLFEL